MLESLRTRWREFLDEHPRLETVVEFLSRYLPPLNYITIHYTYFTVICFVSSLIYWGSSQPARSVGYVDSLFLVTSAMTTTGLNTLNLSQMTIWQQVQLWFLFLIGSPIWISIWTVLARKHAFELRFEDIVEREREKRRQRQGSGLRRAPNLRKILSRSKYSTEPASGDEKLTGLGSRLPFPPAPDPSSTEVKESETELDTPARRTVSAPNGVSSPQLRSGEEEEHASRPEPQHLARLDSPRDHISFVEPVSPRLAEHGKGTKKHRLSRQSSATSSSSSSSSSGSSSGDLEDIIMHWKKFLGKHNVTRNGQFYDLSSDEREHLGGCEYRALKVLAVTVPAYFFLWQFVGAIALGAWLYTRNPGVPEAYGVGSWWTGVFFSVSAFNNGGMALIDDSAIPFQGDYFVLIVIGALILAGNTAYPIFLRLVLWSTLKILQLTTPETFEPEWKETLEFILKYPRRVYTTLFPARATWWLVGVLCFVNCVDWLSFEILNIGNPEIKVLPVGHRIVDGLFQAVSIRAAGFVVVSLPTLYIGVLVLYLVMMYISVYPVVITMRNSNVYEERSLGIYDDDPQLKQQEQQSTGLLGNSDEPGKGNALRRRNTAAVIGKKIRRATTFQGVGAQRTTKADEEPSGISFIGQQIRGQLAHDLWWLVLAILVIVVIETDHFLRDPLTFSVFNILFECVSAYACVGLSIGLPNDSFSFAGGLHTGSKLVLCLVMLRGRHRGLPVALDRAVRLPGDTLIKEEEEDGKIRRTKTMSRIMSREN